MNARWYDPTSGTYTGINGSPFSNSGVSSSRRERPTGVGIATGSFSWRLPVQLPPLPQLQLLRPLLFLRPPLLRPPLFLPPPATATPVASKFNTKINFEPQGVTIPQSYLADTGAVYADRGNGYTYGWNADNSANTRYRQSPSSPDLRYDTLIHMQRGNNLDAKWEIAVPNGTYSVHL